MNPRVESFRDPLTSTFSHVVHDAPGGHAAIIDPVLDYAGPSARTRLTLADQLLAFVRMRTERDASLPEPKLILPALQVNIRGGRLPPPDGNGIRYLRLPLNQIGHDA